jgi:hypothetical protein
MSTPENILAKVKLLLNLRNSPNVNEAEAARIMVEKLIAKYNITTEELASLADKKPLYGEDDKLYMTIGLVGWRQRLALTIGKYYYCKIVQEELVPVDGLSQYHYYVYGEAEDAANVKLVYNVLANKVEELINIKCIGRGQIFISSYCEGVVETINSNIYWNGIDLPDIKKPSKNIEEVKENQGEANISVHKEEKESPVEQSVDVAAGTLIKDINAFYKGIEDGKDISLYEILQLEIENEKIKYLSSEL